MIPSRILLALSVATVSPARAHAQWPPESFENLEVLPEDITFGELFQTMSGFTRALGVRCSFCHIGDENASLDEYDFPSDEKPTKRKPGAAEFEYAHRAGAETVHFWGDESDPVCRFANSADLSLKHVRPGYEGTSPCDDGAPFTSAVGTYRANAWGLHDLAGNVNEWVLDCWKGDHRGKPADGTPYVFDGCPLRRLKGGSWWSGSSGVQIPKNFGFLPTERSPETGFRVVRELVPHHSP